jgi:hypothetical protein
MAAVDNFRYTDLPAFLYLAELSISGTCRAA